MTLEPPAYPPSGGGAGAAPERCAQFADDQHGDLVLMAYHADVRFLDDRSPELIERNAAEFARMRDLLASIDPSKIRARDGTIWESAYRGRYDERLAEVRNLVVGLSAGFDKARVALFRYADEVKRAKQYLVVGRHAERKLDHLVSSVTVAVTPAVQLAEPMRRWEDIRETTGLPDWVAEHGMDPDSIRDEAIRAYGDAGDAFGRAQSIERAAREVCFAELRRAYDILPDVHGEFRHAVAMIAEVVPLSDVARRDVRLPDRVVRDDSFPAGENDISPELQWIRDLVAALPVGLNRWRRDLVGGESHDDCYDFIATNKEIIDAAAYEFRLPSDLLACITCREVGGTPHPLVALIEVLRRAANGDWTPITAQSLPNLVAGNVDFGPMTAPIRRAAEVLGYNPVALSNGQLDEIRTALWDPAQHIFIAAKYLAHLKVKSSFATVPADQLTYAQYEELAARYNGGPHWSDNAAQSYGRDVVANLDQARAALQ